MRTHENADLLLLDMSSTKRCGITFRVLFGHIFKDSELQ